MLQMAKDLVHMRPSDLEVLRKTSDQRVSESQKNSKDEEVMQLRKQVAALQQRLSQLEKKDEVLLGVKGFFLFTVKFIRPDGKTLGFEDVRALLLNLRDYLQEISSYKECTKVTLKIRDSVMVGKSSTSTFFPS